MLYGHSGGGVASFRGAQLIDTNNTIRQVVQVGPSRNSYTTPLNSATIRINPKQTVPDIVNWPGPIFYNWVSEKKDNKVPQKFEQNSISVHTNYFKTRSEFFINGRKTNNLNEIRKGFWN